jgi:hypothetical protein
MMRLLYILFSTGIQSEKSTENAVFPILRIIFTVQCFLSTTESLFEYD